MINDFINPLAFKTSDIEKCLFPTAKGEVFKSLN